MVTAQANQQLKQILLQIIYIIYAWLLEKNNKLKGSVLSFWYKLTSVKLTSTRYFTSNSVKIDFILTTKFKQNALTP